MADEPNPRGFTLRHALLVVLAVAGVWHALYVGGTSLAIHNDGIDYLRTAFAWWDRGVTDISHFRTPGYPALLAACFWTFGMSGTGVMIVQHALGVLTALMVTAMAARFIRPAWAIVPGLFVALDPHLASFCSLMQTEGPSVFTFVLCAFIVVCGGKRPWASAIGLGVALAYAVMLRPGYQSIVPFFAIAACLWRGLNLPTRAGVLCCVGIAFLATSAPWLRYNWNRGIRGFSQGAQATLWVSLVQQDLIDRAWAKNLPPDMARRYQPVARQVGPSNEMWAFIAAPRDPGLEGPEAGTLLKQWAWDSIRENPERYLARVPYAFLWQLNYFPDSGFFKDGQFGWLIWMTSTDMDHMRPGMLPNFHFGVDAPHANPLSMPARGGWLRTFVFWWATEHPKGLPQIPLCILAFFAGLLAVRHRRWDLVVMLLGTAALVSMHAVMVLFQGRYSYPSVIVWWGIAPYPVACAVRFIRNFLRRNIGLPALPPDDLMR